MFVLSELSQMVRLLPKTFSASLQDQVVVGRGEGGCLDG